MGLDCFLQGSASNMVKGFYMTNSSDESDIIVEIATFVESKDWETVLGLCLSLAELSYLEGFSASSSLRYRLKQDATSKKRSGAFL